MELTDSQWALIRLFLPEDNKRGRARAQARRTLNGILYVQQTGCPWRDMPVEYGNPVTCWRRFTQWKSDGYWERIWRAYCAIADDTPIRHAA